MEAVDPDAARAKMAEDGRGAGGGSGKKKGGGRVRRSSVEQVRSLGSLPSKGAASAAASLLAQTADALQPPVDKKFLSGMSLHQVRRFSP